MPLDASTQRVAILRQLATPSLTSRPGDEPLPALEDGPDPGAVTPAEGKKGVSGWAKMLYGAGTGADIATTLMNQKRGLPEGNPMLKVGGPKAVVPLMLGQEIATYLIARKLLGDRHPKIMNALVGGAGAAHGAAAIHNLGLKTPPTKPADSLGDIMVYDTGNGGFIPPK